MKNWDDNSGYSVDFKAENIWTQAYQVPSTLQGHNLCLQACLGPEKAT